MPKVRTDRGAAKRFRVTRNGKVVRRRAFRSHLLEKKSTRRTRRLGRPALVSHADLGTVRRLLGI